MFTSLDIVASVQQCYFSHRKINRKQRRKIGKETKIMSTNFIILSYSISATTHRSNYSLRLFTCTRCEFAIIVQNTRTHQLLYFNSEVKHKFFFVRKTRITMFQRWNRSVETCFSRRKIETLFTAYQMQLFNAGKFSGSST